MIKDASDLERVNREISILKKLRHPHVVQLFDVSGPCHYDYFIDY
jgi:serine/threonine protein kinase